MSEVCGGREGCVSRAVLHGTWPNCCWQLNVEEGIVCVYPGASLWRWFVGDLVHKRCAISAIVYPSPELAMERGQVAMDRVMAGESPRVDWSGEPSGTEFVRVQSWDPRH